MGNGERLVPEVLGLPVAEARRRLAEAGVTEVVEVATAPPRGATEGEARVVRQRERDGCVSLTLAVFPELRTDG